MAGQQIEQSFKAVVERVWEVLKPLGFRKQGHRFRRQEAGNVTIIEFQRSQDGDASHIKFTLNLGVVSRALAHRLDPEAEIGKAVVADAHLRQRIGTLLPSMQDHWWILAVGSDEATLGNEVAAAVEKHAAPFLDKVGRDDRLVALWQ